MNITGGICKNTGIPFFDFFKKVPSSWLSVLQKCTILRIYMNMFYTEALSKQTDQKNVINQKWKKMYFWKKGCLYFYNHPMLYSNHPLLFVRYLGWQITGTPSHYKGGGYQIWNFIYCLGFYCNLPHFLGRKHYPAIGLLQPPQMGSVLVCTNKINKSV